MDDALEVTNIEEVANHDVKAVEYFFKKKCPEISKVKNPILLAWDSLPRYWIFLRLPNDDSFAGVVWKYNKICILYFKETFSLKYL